MRDEKTGLCVHCKPDEEGEIIGLVRPDDRGGPEKFQVFIDFCWSEIVSDRSQNFESLLQIYGPI